MPADKLELNLKPQNSMIKTCTTVVKHRFTDSCLPVMMTIGATLEELFVWNFEFGSLGFV
jgi:hypothetical protein